MKVEKNELIQALKVDDIKSKPLKNIKVEGFKLVKTAFGEKILMNFKHNGKDAAAFVNNISKNNLIEAFGDETDLWVGKYVDLTVLNSKESLNTDTIVIKKSA